MNILTWITELQVGDKVIRDDQFTGSKNRTVHTITGTSPKKLILDNGEVWDIEHNREFGRSKHERIFLRPAREGEMEELSRAKEQLEYHNQQQAERKRIERQHQDLLNEVLSLFNRDNAGSYRRSSSRLEQLPEELLHIYKQKIEEAHTEYEERYGRLPAIRR